jgi:hypothetical protein
MTKLLFVGLKLIDFNQKQPLILKNITVLHIFQINQIFFIKNQPNSTKSYQKQS